MSTLEVDIFRDVQALSVSPTNLADTTAALSEIVRRNFAVDRCAIYLLDKTSDELILESFESREDASECRLPLGWGITGLCALQGRPIQVPHIGRDPRVRWLPNQDRSSRSMVALPLLQDGQLIGAFNLQTVVERHFSDEEMEVLERVVTKIVIAAVAGAQSYETIQRRTDELQILNELGQLINTNLELDESLELIAERATETLNAKAAAIRIAVEDHTLALGAVVVKAGPGFDLQHERVIAEYVAHMGEPIMIDDVRTDWQPWNLGSSLICIPLVLEERVVGTLTLFDKIVPAGNARRLFSTDDLNLLFLLSSQVAGEIEEIRLTTQLQASIRNEKQNAEQLEQLYSRSQALIESISDGLLAVGPDGSVTQANSLAKRLFGAPDDELEGRNIDSVIEDKPPLSQWLGRAGKFSNRVVTMNTGAGKVAAMANLQPVVDGSGKGLGAVITFREMGEVGRLVNGAIGVQRTFTFDDLVGDSAVVRKCVELARIASSTDSNILIQGETGTGKEVFAQAIHNASRFSDGPFLAVNCAAMPRDLIESELFGYVEGAFTGASRNGRLGKFELASGGSLFLDEIGDIPIDVQVKLLRVLQERTVVRVGGDRTIPINCRLIAATNRDLSRAVEEGSFRSDLLYRLNVITVEVPSLRDRVEDLPQFINRFIDQWNDSLGKAVKGVAPQVLDKLAAYEWPGNVREVENVVERAMALAKGEWIQAEDIPSHLLLNISSDGERPRELTGPVILAKQNYEASVQRLYAEALRSENGNVPRAAQVLGMSRATFYRKLKKYGLSDLVSQLRI